MFSTARQRQRTNYFWGPLGVIRYDLQRSFSPARLLSWAILALFPVLLVGMAKWKLVGSQPQLPEPQLTMFFSIVLFILLCQVVTVLSLLLWATPAINAELEGQTWIYAAVRPGGKTAMVVGKYIVAVLWTVTTGWIAATICVPITGVSEPFRLWWTLMRLVTLSGIAYGALYIALGALVQRRAMVAAFLYTLIVEVILSVIPATINQLTIGFRLRSLGAQWQDLKMIKGEPNVTMILEMDGTSRHVWILAVFTAVMLSIALLRVRYGEYSLNAEAT